MKAYDSSDLKDLNRTKVFDFIKQNGICSRTHIARATGISAPTVLKISGFLLAEGLISEAGKTSKTVGRKPQMLTLNQSRYNAIGALVEGVYVRVGLVNLNARVDYLITEETNGDLKVIMTEVLPKLIRQLIEESHVDPSIILGVGVGLPCVYDAANHQIKNASLVRQQGTVPIISWEETLSSKSGFEILIDNDANMQAFGEYRTRKYTNEDFIYISIGTGLGAGVFLDGKLRQGSSYQCGEIGYMVFDEDQVIDPNQPGWLEQRMNLKALESKFSTLQDREKKLDYLARKIATCISNIEAFIDCDRICLGGILVEKMGDQLIDYVRKRLSEKCMRSVDLQQSVCAEPGIVGAATRILEKGMASILMK